MQTFSNGQMVLTKDIERKLPPLYSQDGEGEAAIAQVKFFTVVADWTWYASEYAADTGVFFGLVGSPYATELGYWTIDDLMSIQVGVLGVERDKAWTPRPLSLCR